jgi:hypothetical protein
MAVISPPATASEASQSTQTDPRLDFFETVGAWSPWWLGVVILAAGQTISRIYGEQLKFQARNSDFVCFG